MKQTLIAVLALAVALTATSRGLATATARASGHVGDGSTIADFQSGANSAPPAKKNNLDDAFALDTFQSTASVTGPKLHAYAEVNLVTQGSSVAAAAEATWADAIQVANPDLVDAGAFIYFRPQAKGFVSLFGARASFYVALSHPLTGEIIAEQYLDTDDTLDTLKTQLRVPLYDFLGPVAYYMSLSASAALDTNPHSAMADYDHTAYLPPLFIGDADGNPLPSQAGIKFTSESGYNYSVTTIQRTPGDYNGDGTVDGADYVVWRHALGQNGGQFQANADGNGDGVVDDEDLEVWQANFGDHAGSSAALSQSTSVPEPTSCALTAAGFFVASLLHTRRRGPA